MLSHLNSYIEPIFNACILFPLIAGLFTMPFMIMQYRRYGGIALMRVIVVYSFILYSMCAFLLTVLPLPSIEAVQNMKEHSIQFIPFYDLYVAMSGAGFSFSAPSSFVSGSVWKAFLTSRDLFQIIANIVMQIPLGFYLRYYFRKSWKQTLVIGLCVSLFYELTQLSGLFFIYPKPYRYTEIDDLINNTLGAMIGFWIAPLIGKLLPSRDEIDKISYDKGHRITVIRRVFAASIDWTILFAIWFFFVPPSNEGSSAKTFVTTVFWGYIIWVTVYFILFQWLLKGRTLGKALIRLKVVDTADKTSPPSLGRLAVRYMMIYFLSMPLLMLEFIMLSVLALMAYMSESLRLILIIACVAILMLTLFLLIRFFRKWNTFPHGHYSRTTIANTTNDFSRRSLKASRTSHQTDSQP